MANVSPLALPPPPPTSRRGRSLLLPRIFSLSLLGGSHSRPPIQPPPHTHRKKKSTFKNNTLRLPVTCSAVNARWRCLGADGANKKKKRSLNFKRLASPPTPSLCDSSRCWQHPLSAAAEAIAAHSKMAPKDTLLIQIR